VNVNWNINYILQTPIRPDTLLPPGSHLAPLQLIRLYWIVSIDTQVGNAAATGIVCQAAWEKLSCEQSSSALLASMR
jgi:hypothetical protein